MTTSGILSKRRRLSVSNGRLRVGACEKIPRTFPDRVATIYKILFLPLSIPYVSVCVRRANNFDSGGICGGPLFAPPSTSARVYDSFEFVELGGDIPSNYHDEAPAGNWNCKPLPRCYQPVPRTTFLHVYMVFRGTRFTCSIGMNMGMRTYPLRRT